MDDDSKAAVRETLAPDDPVASQHPAAAPVAEPDDESGPSEQTQRLLELRTTRRLLMGIFILMALGAVYFASIILVPLAAAMLVNFLFKPLVRRLEYLRVAPPLSAMFIIGGLLLALLVGGSMVWGSLAAWVTGIPQNIERLEQKLSSVQLPMREINEATEKIEQVAEANGEGAPVNEPVEVRVRESAFPTTIFNVTSSVIAGFTITLVIAYFLLASGDLLLRQLVQMLPSLTDKKEAVQAVYDLESHVSSYLVTVTMINLGLAVVVWAVLLLLGVPHAMWWGLTAGAANFIPYLGPLVTAVLIFLASLLALPTAGQALIPPLAFITITSIEGYFVTPTILGRRLSLNPLILILWLVFWGWVWGIAGALLAVPMLVCFKIICDHIESLEPLSNVLSGYVRRPGEG